MGSIGPTKATDGQVHAVAVNWDGGDDRQGYRGQAGDALSCPMAGTSAPSAGRGRAVGFVKRDVVAYEDLGTEAIGALRSGLPAIVCTIVSGDLYPDGVRRTRCRSIARRRGWSGFFEMTAVTWCGTRRPSRRHLRRTRGGRSPRYLVLISSSCTRRGGLPERALFAPRTVPFLLAVHRQACRTPPSAFLPSSRCRWIGTVARLFILWARYSSAHLLYSARLLTPFCCRLPGAR